MKPQSLVAVPEFKKKQQLMTPSLRFPLLAGGTEPVRGAVPLAKRGEPTLKGIGFLRACLLTALPSSASLPPCERDARNVNRARKNLPL